MINICSTFAGLDLDLKYMYNSQGMNTSRLVFKTLEQEQQTEII